MENQLNTKEYDQLQGYQLRCAIMQEYLDKKIKRKQAAKWLNITIKQVTRLANNARANGMQGLIHGNTGVTRPKKFSGTTAEQIIGYYTGQYALVQNDSSLDYSNYSVLAFHTELTYGSLMKLKIKISYTTLLNGIKSFGIVPTNSKRNKTSHKLNGADLNTKYKMGERLELDACEFDWFGTGKVQKAHVVYDRGLRAPIAIHIEDEETTVGYLKAMSIVLENYGVPQKIIGDRRGTFVNLKKQGTEKEYQTMFNKALLFSYDIDYYFTSNPDAKPGVESCNNYIQKQLPTEFARLNIKTADEANEYFKEYCLKRIRVHYDENIENVFGPKVSNEDIRESFICKEKNVSVDGKSFIRYEGMQYVAIRNETAYKYHPKQKVLVQENYLGEIWQKLPNSIVELRKATDKDLPQLKTNEVKKFIRKVSDRFTIKCESKQYILQQINGMHLELNMKQEVEVEQTNDSLVGRIEGKCYKLVKVDEYVNKHLLLPKRECKTKFDFTVNYNGERYVILSNKKEPLIIEEHSLVTLKMKNYQLQCYIKGNIYSVVLYKDYQYKTLLPKSRRIYENLIYNTRKSQIIFDNYDPKLLEQ